MTGHSENEEIREYTKMEIAAELRVSETAKNLRQCITQKMDRLGIGYSVSGRAENAIFQITSMGNF